MNSRRGQERLFVKYHLYLLLSTLLVPACAVSTPNPSTAQIIYYRNEAPDASGNYNFEFQTSNGITTKGAGNEHGAVGVVQYISQEGIPVTFTYLADANGYQPSGDFAPKHLNSQLEYIRTHPLVNEVKSRRW